MLNENDARCPWCGKVNPPIRRVPAFATSTGCTVIYSCGNCKRILSLETILLGDRNVTVEEIKNAPDNNTDDSAKSERAA